MEASSSRSRNVHVKLDRDTHVRFKAGLASMDATMQEAFAFFALCIAEGNKSALRMVEQMKRQRVRDALSGTGLKPGLGGRRRTVGELNSDELYDMIEAHDEATLPAEE